MRQSSVVLLVIGAALILGGLVTWMSVAPSSGAPAMFATSTIAATAGLQTGTAPWPPELAHLSARLAEIGLPELSAEGTALHIHEHLDIFVNGARVSVPADIGIAPAYISPLHTHDATGVIHVESPTVRDFTLGEFFDVWGVRFSASELGGYTTDATHTLAVYANGVKVEGDPRNLILTAHQEIAIVFGNASSAVSIPSDYAFDPGL